MAGTSASSCQSLTLSRGLRPSLTISKRHVSGGSQNPLWPLPSPHTPHPKKKKKFRSAASILRAPPETLRLRAGTTLPVATQEAQGRLRQTTKSWPQPRRHPLGAKEPIAWSVTLQAGGERATSSCGQAQLCASGSGPGRELASLDMDRDTGALSSLFSSIHRGLPQPSVCLGKPPHRHARLPAMRLPWNISALTKT